jgi:hypothetical protein
MEHEIDLGGIYISPFVVMLVLCVVIFYPLRAFLDHIEFEKYVWHRTLADACLFIITLGLLVLIL